MSKRILLIDSDEPFARSLQAALEGRGLTALIATNSEQGMAAAKSDRPDLIIVCVEAQPTNGYMLCTRLKKDDQLKAVPVILTSANATPDSFEKHKKLKTRAEEYLIKPFEPQALFDRIGLLLKIDLPAAATIAQEEIVSMEDEPLGLGDLVGEDEPLHMTDSEAREAHAGLPPAAQDVELDTVDVEEVLHEEPPAPAVAAAPAAEPAQSNEAHPASASDEDLDMLDAAFDALSPASKAPPPNSQVEPTVIHDFESQPVHTEPVSAAQPSAPAIDPDAQAALEARIHELETQLATRDAELEVAKKGSAAGINAAEMRKLREARSKADKENVRLKDELNEKEKELIELRDQQSALEHQAQTLQDDAVKREAAAKALQQRAEALAAAAKKFERELGAAREELKSVPGHKARIAELEKLEVAHLELQKTHAGFAAEVAQHKAQAAAMGAQAAQQKERANSLEAQLLDAQGLHENEVAGVREQRDTELANLRTTQERELAGVRAEHDGEIDELRAELQAQKAAAQKREEELTAASGEHTLALDSAQAEVAKMQADLATTLDAAEKAQAELESANSTIEKLQAELKEAKEASAKSQSELQALRESRQNLESERATMQEARDKAQADLGQAREAAEKAVADLETARADASALTGERHLLSDERDELRRQLEEANTLASRNEQRAVQAYQRIKGDEKLREKTKKALQIALQLLDEVSTLPEEESAAEPAQLEQQSA